jgi:hypothetical protein
MAVDRATRGERLQVLWSGYGEVVRVHLSDGRSVVVKAVDPAEPSHPLGWSGARGHARKLRSYAVESAWYERWADRCSDRCRVPRCIGRQTDGDRRLFLLEDLDAQGFDERRRTVSDDELVACLRWLASFHATFLGEMPDGLWPVGTYWHLDTRPDELAAMAPGALRDAAGVIDARLSAARWQTFVHGDAKVANFCFGSGGVAAVDFQYVGGGVGVKDLAYFLGSVLGDRELSRDAARWEEVYFAALRSFGGERAEAEWRELLPWAWADFERFLAGWSPGHWKRSGYAHTQVMQVLTRC